jgi:hypothetical protein
MGTSPRPALARLRRRLALATTSTVAPPHRLIPSPGCPVRELHPSEIGPGLDVHNIPIRILTVYRGINSQPSRFNQSWRCNAVLDPVQSFGSPSTIHRFTSLRHAVYWRKQMYSLAVPDIPHILKEPFSNVYWPKGGPLIRRDRIGDSCGLGTYGCLRCGQRVIQRLGGGTGSHER